MDDLEQKTRELKKRLKKSVLTKELLERTIISLGLYRRVSGVLGPFIIANANGKMIIRLRPKDFQMSMTAASIANRRNMAAANKFAMFLKRIPSIYKTWAKAPLKGNNPFTRIIRYNKKHLVNDCPSSANSITPDNCQLIIENIISAERNGKIKVSNDYLPQKGEKLVVVLSASKPKYKNINPFECFNLNSTSIEAGKTLELNSWQKAVCRNYEKFIFYAAVIREDGKNVSWSNTCVFEADFDFGIDYSLAERKWYGQILSLVFQTIDLRESNFVIKPPG